MNKLFEPRLILRKQVDDKEEKRRKFNKELQVIKWLQGFVENGIASKPWSRAEVSSNWMFFFFGVLHFLHNCEFTNINYMLRIDMPKLGLGGCPGKQGAELPLPMAAVLS